MSKHSEIGIKGEQIAEYFLQKKGYIILQKNWKVGKKEVDIIAQMGDIIVIVEVKSRSSMGIAFPEEAVNYKKKLNIKFVANIFMRKHPQYKHLRFDIISVLFHKSGTEEVVHFEEAFH